MKITTSPPDQSSKDQNDSYSRNIVLETDQEVFNYIAMLSLFLQSGQSGIPRNQPNSNLTRANFYKAPRVKHFHQKSNIPNPLLQYQTVVPQDNCAESGLEGNSLENKSAVLNHGFETSVESQTPEIIKNYSQVQEPNVETLSKSINIDNEQECTVNDNISLFPMLPADYFDNNSTEYIQDENPLPEFPSPNPPFNFEEYEESFLKEGSETYDSSSFYTSMTSDILEPENPATKINQQMKQFNTGSSPLSLNLDFEQVFENELTQTIKEEPTTPVKPADILSHSNAYFTPITSHRISKKLKTLSSQLNNPLQFNTPAISELRVRKRQDMQNTPIRRSEYTVSNGKVVKNQDESKSSRRKPSHLQKSVYIKTEDL